MSDIIVGDKQDLVAVADSIRGLVGGGQMYVSEMATNINGAKTAVDAALTAISEKGVEVPAGTNVTGLAALIAAIEAGGGSGGSFEVSTGVITPTSTATTLTWEHGLSVAPSYVILFAPIGYSMGTQANTLRAYYEKKDAYTTNIVNMHDVYRTRTNANYMYHEASLSGNEKPWTITDKDVTAKECRFGESSVASFVAGIPYFWLCISGDVIFPK